MLQNRSSSSEFEHANTEARVSGHCLDSNGKSMKWVSKKEGIFPSQNENGKWDLEYFFEIEVGLRIFLSEEKTKEKLDLENVCPKRRKGERELDLKEPVQVKRRRKVK